MPELSDLIGGGLEISSNLLRRQALTGDATASAGSNAVTVPAAAAEIVVEATSAALTNGKVLGTTVISKVAYASRQAFAKAGRLFFPSDGYVVERDTGSAWEPWGPIFPLTAPVDSDFTWTNQGSASVSTTKGGIYLLSGTAGAGVNLRVRKKSAPSTPYTITAAFLPLMPQLDSMYMGLCFREAGTGEIHTFNIQSVAADGAGITIRSSKWSSATAFSAHYTTTGSLIKYDLARGVVWLRIADDGANRICSISVDGQNFMAVHSVGRTDFLTADEVGFFTAADNADYAAAMTLLAWKQA